MDLRVNYESFDNQGLVIDETVFNIKILRLRKIENECTVGPQWVSISNQISYSMTTGQQQQWQNDSSSLHRFDPRICSEALVG